MKTYTLTITRSLPRHGPALLLVALLGGCGGGGVGQDPDPLVEDFGMAYVRRPLEINNGLASMPAITELEDFSAGGDLFYRDLASPSAPERNVTGVLTGGLGDVKDVEVSWDGGTLLFALHMPDDPDADIPPTWNIWEYDIAADTLTRVIADDAIADAADDVAPHYLPDGRIIFSSSRQEQFQDNLLDESIAWPVPRATDFHAVVEETNQRDHAMVLHVLARDNVGNVDIKQVSMNQSHDLDPMVRRSGEVVFSRWDNMGNRNAVSLYQMHPDGSELQLLYGAHSHATGSNGATVQFTQPREMDDGRLLTLLRPFNNRSGGGDLVLIDIGNYTENSYPTAINLGVLFGPAQVPATQIAVATDSDISPGGHFLSAWPLADNTDRLLVSWSACRLLIDDIIQPCTASNLADPDAAPADPIYGIFMYDMASDTLLPVVAPEEGVAFSDVVAAMPRIDPMVIFDKERAIELEAEAFDENVGYLDIRSVYDVDGVDTTPAGIAVMADPAQTPPDTIPARFLRIVKAVGIPDDDVREVPRSAYGASAGQLMREIIGYVPIQPDGSVRVKVPANVPLAISVVDSNGRRIGPRHQNWLQVRPGDTLACNGCHDHDSDIPHGHPYGPVSVWAGAPAGVFAFPNTDTALFTEPAETMAQTLTRNRPATAYPSVDVIFEDVWTNPLDAGLTAADPIGYRYADLSTPVPLIDADCQDNWNTLCRTVINYEQHIHPLWSTARGDATCTGCHFASADHVPDGQLDLGDGYAAEPQFADYFKSYRELFFQDNEQVVGAMGLEDRVEDGPIDPVSGLPTPVFFAVAPTMSAAGAAASDAFFARFVPGGPDAIHAGILTPAELRLLAEWLDIGAQYYNDPFAVP